MAFYNTEFWEWVNSHRDIDPLRLRLNHRVSEPWIDDAISQIENEKRGRSKFGVFNESSLIPKLMPISRSIEQATSPAVAQFHYQLSGLNMTKSSRVLDMTCGLGIDVSFLAQDPLTQITALDLDEKIALIAKENFSHRPNIEIINGDSIEYLKNSSEHFDLIFIDPARRDITGKRLYNLHDCQPDVTDILPLMKMKSSRIMIKMSPMLDVTQTLRDIPDINELYIIDERGECRELLAIIDANSDLKQLITVKTGNTQFSFRQAEEVESTATTSMPVVGQYLLEPSPAMMKAGAFKLLCHRFDATMIHQNTHLLLTDCKPVGFPGKVYVIDDILPYSSSNIKKIAKLKLNADVATRNFPTGADALKSKLQIKKSGSTRIIGVTAANSKPYLLMMQC